MSLCDTPVKLIATAKQAKRYSDKERVAAIENFRNSRISLSNFCKQEGNPSYQVMKAWIADSTIASHSKNSATNIGKIDDLAKRTPPKSKDEHIEILYRKLADLRLQMTAIEHEIIKLENETDDGHAP
ncbi:hypothetical protein C206_08744 [Pseudomonas putida TRO1]|uniref:Transposase n=3 Tax=Pseudomonas TaxID=286 RepID=A0AAP7KEV2_9PSED|nr:MULTISPECIES: hypothetical protein [Pseudomonas]ELM3787974.1 hypothetical protein [Pseudomonas aeruginosa]ELM3812687.1 hypothetical protein [Pseudomonas aeruginosa]ELS0927294.1 hypothetical protein [Pseudomonas putida]ENY78058.1 hypothetical protein C206_08744 [Pseudomonas putida TRO1]OAH47902.1 hypothetical protein AYJ70_05825 [Pseudomonas monteilii]